jgi:hypothetical protein
MFGPGGLIWLKQVPVPVSLPITLTFDGNIKSRLIYVFGIRIARWTL